MEKKKFQKLSIAALIISVLPLATFIPILFKFTLSGGIQGIWSAANMVFVLLGLCLSIVCVRNSESRSAVNIIAMIISILWVLMVAGFITLAFLLNFQQ
ncbi:hypothetical protein LAD12857_36840 [Lacrimispora amygdalina]|uniref:Uncharacterized protein n=1 Tax=Lacrimispora amygdalina TaxID=253257 RepID=A0ABQ5MAB8_9FIRM